MDVAVIGLPTTTEGPADRFHSIFERHYGSVARYAARRVGFDDADDVADEVFTVAWRKIAEAPAEPDTRWWLLGIARRIVGNQLRSHRRRQRLEARIPRPDLAVDPDADDDVLAVLRTLNRIDQEVLTLMAWEDLRPREIAIVLGCSPGTAAVRAHRARARLAEALEREGWHQ